DLNTPLDNSANNALHWAATLAKIPLLKLLIARGANMYRGNAAGQSPLISAVLVSNCWEKSCFPELLEVLGGLIEVRDAQARTVLHHIGVSSGIKGRGGSGKYYLEALLEYLVRVGTAGPVPISAAANPRAGVKGEGPSSQDSATSRTGHAGVSLVRFLSHIVNARDKAGNTALNLVARIGNRSIIQQLLEIHADPTLPNHKGVSARDFGVGVEAGEPVGGGGGSASQQLSQQTVGGTQETLLDGAVDDGAGVQQQQQGSRVEELERGLVESVTGMLTQNLAAHRELLRARGERIDGLNEQLR
ncbi:transcriptional regulator swi6, partial [Teratosphaeriaceae sp. CCFEE 6253]